MQKIRDPMNSKERVVRTLEFKNPDKIPQDTWLLPAAETKYGKELDILIHSGNQDIFTMVCPVDIGYENKIYRPGTYRDPWGCTWKNLQSGIAGEVKHPAIDEWGQLASYKLPFDKLESFDWRNIQANVEKNNNKFILGGWINIFERMQFIRGTESLFIDLALNDKNILKLRDMLFEFYDLYLNKWLIFNIDGIRFGDDWGAQKQLLISPVVWREIFKPVYKKLFRKIIDKGKYVFFHSDGYILDLYMDFIEIGVHAINSQLWCMGVENVAEKYAGKTTFWGEISRQNILPFGSVKEVYNAKNIMRKYLFIDGGGLIGQSEIGPDVPLENIEALLHEW
jgi:uroporphyrinogen decarboxylase